MCDLEWSALQVSPSGRFAQETVQIRIDDSWTLQCVTKVGGGGAERRPLLPA
jgi:hypothetical protein